MTSDQRKATLWGFLFPLLTLGGIVGVMGLTGRGTAPATQAAGTQAAGNQNMAQSNSTMSGTGASTTPNTTAGTTASAPATPATSASGTAAPAGGAQAAAPQGAAGTAAQGTAAQGSAAQAPVAGISTTGTAATGTSTPGAASQAPAGGSVASGAAPAGTQAAAPAPQGTPVQASANGAQVYTTNCTSCHGEQGAGVAGAFPALAGNKAVLGDDKYLSNVLLYGLQGQINANGQVYNGVMPAWAASLTDAEIAAVITHIRTSWGNTAPAVAEATVKAERGTPKSAVQVLAQRPQ